MLQPSEFVAMKLLPAIRARLAQILLDDYHMKQVKVAEVMGVTQAAVSHYNTRSRAADNDILQTFPEIEESLKKLAYRINKGLSRPDQVAAIEELCQQIARTEKFCEFHRRHCDLGSDCQICFPAKRST